jgi:hypothetical protein
MGSVFGKAIKANRPDEQRIIRPNSRFPGVRAPHPGRPVGKPAGSYMSDLWELKKAIWLCWECRHKFDFKRHHYFYEKNLRVNGNCDGCREYRPGAHFFVHESLLVNSGGRSVSGQSWIPR